MLALSCGLVACGDGADKALAPSAPADAAVVLPAPRESRAADAGRRACEGRSPVAVRKAYAKVAAKQASRVDRRFLRAVAKQRAASTVPLAARLYAMSVPKSFRAEAYAGCAYELSMKSEKGSRR